jgi:hypothetical protein
MKKTITARMHLEITISEMDTINAIAEEKGITKTAVIRQALKIYQIINESSKTGNHLTIGNQKVIVL